MRGKIAKKLRREAEERTKGMPLVKYATIGHSILHKGKKYRSEQVVLRDCTRKVYKELKKEQRKHGRIQKNEV
jgi:hypothetical protein